MAGQRILVVEDEEALREGLIESFTGQGFSAQPCARGDLALAAVESFKPDLIVLDLMLPGMHGLEICKALRARGASLPIIMLTAMADEQQVINGLQAGADDYIAKPFRLAELQARVQAQLRRAQAAFGAALELPGCRVDLIRGEVVREGKSTSLTQLEVELLKFLLKSRPSPVSRENLLVEVWGYKQAIATRTVDMAVAKLRAKVERNVGKPEVIITVRDSGYRLELPGAAK
ncbi:MAG: response regulator transcription factor [Planctomycetes bacterium]|nr:response regulator transcription factor [Planctomycetota bacterium]